MSDERRTGNDRSGTDVMDGATMRAWFWWSAWAPARVEAWLEAKAAQGWQLVTADRALLRFHFKRDLPRTVRISADFPADPSDEYHTIFTDAGWRVVASGAGWYLWRMEYSGARPEAFTDTESLLNRNMRTLAMLLAGLAGLLYLTFINPFLGLFESTFGAALGVLMVLLMIVWTLAIGATSAVIVALKQQRRVTGR